MKRSLLCACFLAALLPWMAGAAAGGSASYNKPSDTLDAGGRTGSSTRYHHAGHAGGVSGEGASGSFVVQSGFMTQLSNSTVPPTSLALDPSAVDENLSAGTIVGLLGGTDPDVGDTLSFMLVPGAGATDNALFSIIGNELRTAAMFDQEAQPTRSIRVRGMDSGGLFIETVFVITINDIRTEDADGDTLTEAEEEDIHGTSDVLADTDGDSLNDGVEVAFGSNPTLATSTVSMLLTGATVEFAARASTTVGTVAFSTGPQTGVTFSLATGPGDSANSFFKLAGAVLQTKPAMLMIFENTASVRLRATKGLVYLEQSFTLTIQQKMPDKLVLPVAPPGNTPDIADNFGGGYAGPFNNSGVAISSSRMVVAAPGVQRAYVYDFAGESPDVPVLTLSSPTAGTFDSYASFYGRSVAIDGNLVVVGSEDGISAAPAHQGVVYVYDLTSATPEVPVFELRNPVVAYTNQFASSVAISGRRVVVSSPTSSNGDGTFAGRVHVYDLDSATPTVPVTTLLSPTGMNDNEFGNDVAISGGRIAVGGYMDPPSSPPPPGRVYIYDWSGATPVLQHTIINPTPYNGATENFAENIALSGSRLLVGAREERSTPNVSGAAYLYDLDGATPTTPVLTLNDPSGIVFAEFGTAVALNGTRAAISAVVEGQSPGKLHRVYLYDFASATPSVPVATLLNPQPTMAGSNPNDYFGESVAIAGSLMAVGAEGSDIEGPNKGYAWIYGPASANAVPVLTLTGANPLAYEARTTYTDPGAAATDAEEGTITPVISADTVVANVPGTYSVTWSATDSIGAVSTKTRTVIVIPSAPPSLSAPMGGFVPLTLMEGTPLPDYAATAIAIDNSGSVTVAQSIAAGTVLAPGTYTITITATDGAGHQTTLSFNVTVSALPATGVFSDDFPLNPKNMWWHNDFTAHPTNGWIYGICARGGQFDKGMIYRVSTAGEYQTLVHFTDNGLQNRGTEAAGRMALGADGNFYGVTADGVASTLGSVFKMTPEGAFTTLAQFTGISGASPGDEPTGGLVAGPDGNFYGTAQRGGADNRGVVFRCTPGGILTALVQFTGVSGAAKGSYPIGSLAVGPDGALYGTTLLGGSLDLGTVFKVTTGGVFTTLVEFTSAGASNRGHNPNGGLTLAADDNFYGMTTFGGASNIGTVFRMTPAGVLTTLVEFTGNGATGKGSKPVGDLTLGSDGHLYGLTSEGGASGKGTVFRITTDGVHTVLVHFSGTSGAAKGAFPKGSMAQGLDGNFYGNTQNGGAADQGTVFKMTPAGTLTTLLESTNFYRGGTSKGDSPRGGLCPAPDGSLYGTTDRGGNADLGTVFKIDATGNRITLVHFSGVSGASRGARPQAGLVLASDGNFYGSTTEGGANDMGTLFRLTPAGVLTTLVDFTGNGATNKGAWCSTRLVQGPDGHLYGMGNGGGAGDYGTIFRMTLAGELTTLIEFTAGGGSNPGAWPIGALTLGPDGIFYGMTNSGGTNDKGTIFKFDPETNAMTVLVNFTLTGTGQNRGGWPWGGLTFGSDGALYGLTNYGGLNNFGTIFKTTPSGDITTLVDFTGTAGAARGAYPVSTLFAAPDGFLYGTVNKGGNNDRGVLFKMTTGGAITPLVDFKGQGVGIEGGAWPYMDEFVLGQDRQLYGMTNVGGRQGGGMVYRIEMPVPDITVSGNGQNIANNDSTPSETDHTNFGETPVASGSVTRSFTIANSGALDLTLGAVNITGANAEDFTISTTPANTVAAGGSTTLGITFEPSAKGLRAALVIVGTNDPDEAPFSFAISGNGNSPPSFIGLTIDTVQGNVTAIDEATILLNASDVDGDTVSITGFSATSAQGATITRAGGLITWTPSPVFIGGDTFTVTLSDGMSTAQGTITLSVAADPGLNPNNRPQLTAQPGGVIRLAFSGVPGRVYGIQRSTNLKTWTQIAAPTANAQGGVSFDDSSPPQDWAFYRIIFPAE